MYLHPESGSFWNLRQTYGKEGNENGMNRACPSLGDVIAMTLKRQQISKIIALISIKVNSLSV
jgi:hypothetical protein